MIMIPERTRKCFFAFMLAVAWAAMGEEAPAFKIRKCCAENELILEKTNECVEFALLKMDRHIYRHENESSSGLVAADPESTRSRPWWFPSEKRILSKKTNASLDRFPSNFQPSFAGGPPCDILETVYLPLYLSQFDFYEDGSLMVYPNSSYGFHTQKVEILFEPMSYCIDRMELTSDYTEEEMSPTLNFPDTVDYLIMLCPCKQATCILKCCPPGMVIDVENMKDQDNACVKSPPDEEDWVPNYSKLESDPRDYFLLHRFPICKPDEGTVIPNQFKVDGHTIYSNGSAHIYGETHVNQPMEFCGENFMSRRGEEKVYNHIIRCYPEVGIKNGKSEFRRMLYGCLFVIGAIFLFMTLIVHGLLPPRSNINDKNLISQTWSLFIGYVCVATSQLGMNKLSQNVCILLGFLIQYSFLAAFFWLNILCFDISWTFSELRLVRGIPSKRSHKKFKYYSIYCWVTPAVISLLTAFMEFLPGIPDYVIKPQIKERCWFRNDSVAILAYFYGPIAVLLSINILLFMHTLYRIYQAQRDIQNVIKNTSPEKQRFILYMKLLLLMGLPWVAELISWMVGGPSYYWYFTDIINLLRAVFIFAVFCCKKQVLIELKRKFGIMHQPHIRRPSIPRTSSSFFASTQCQELPKCSNNAVSSL